MIGSNINHLSISGVQILNWADKKNEFTLHRELTRIKSIYPKRIAGKNNATFTGRLFYVIVPNQSRKTIDLYVSSENHM